MLESKSKLEGEAAAVEAALRLNREAATRQADSVTTTSEHDITLRQNRNSAEGSEAGFVTHRSLFGSSNVGSSNALSRSSSRSSLAPPPLDFPVNRRLERSASFSRLFGVNTTVGAAQNFLRFGHRELGKGSTKKVLYSPEINPDRVICRPVEFTHKANIQFYLEEKLAHTFLTRLLDNPDPDLLIPLDVVVSKVVSPGEVFTAVEYSQDSVSGLMKDKALKPLLVSAASRLVSKFSIIHRLGLLIRDVKPSNLVTGSGRFEDDQHCFPFGKLFQEIFSGPAEDEPGNELVFKVIDFGFLTLVDQAVRESFIDAIVDGEEFSEIVSNKLLSEKRKALGVGDRLVGVAPHELAKELNKHRENLKKQSSLQQPLGTYEYASPKLGEEGHEYRAADDLYSLGASLLDLATGRKTVGTEGRPAEKCNRAQLLEYFNACHNTRIEQLDNGNLRDVHGRRLTTEFKEIIREMLLNADSDEPKSAEDFMRQLNELEAGIYCKGLKQCIPI